MNVAHTNTSVVSITEDKSIMSSLTFSLVYNKERAKQNLKNINFEENSDDDREWANSTNDEDLLFNQPRQSLMDLNVTCAIFHQRTQLV